MREIKIYTFLLLPILIISSCKKEIQQITSEPISSYYPLKIGNSISYKLDSTVYINFGTEKKVRSYVVKEVVDSMITDNLGRNSYKIRKKVRNNIDTSIWEDFSSYLVTYHDKRLMLVENNQRYLKLIEPIRNNIEWNGNSYINTISNPELQYLNQWKYYYTDVGIPFASSIMTFSETISVMQQNDILGDTSNMDFYFELNYAKEVYAKGIGLVYKNFIHEVWQPKNATSSTGYYEPNSYGIKLTYLGRNF